MEPTLAACPPDYPPARKFLDVAAELLNEGSEAVALCKVVMPLVRDLASLVAQPRDVLAALPAKDQRQLLLTAASVLEKAASSSHKLVKAADALARLKMALDGGPTQRTKQAGEMSERELVGVVVNTAKKLSADNGVCVCCGAKLAA